MILNGAVRWPLLGLQDSINVSRPDLDCFRPLWSWNKIAIQFRKYSWVWQYRCELTCVLYTKDTEEILLSYWYSKIEMNSSSTDRNGDKSNSYLHTSRASQKTIFIKKRKEEMYSAIEFITRKIYTKRFWFLRESQLTEKYVFV